MHRRNFIVTSAGLLVAGAVAGHSLAAAAAATAGPSSEAGSRAGPLQPPASGPVRVAVAIAEGATVIDFCGPWEVFQDVMLPSDHDGAMPFELYTVATTREPVRASAGLHIIPDFTVNDAPAPNVIVVPALRADDTLRAWIKETSGRTDLTMSVCTGAFHVAEAGLFDGKRATTHHSFYDPFAKDYPKVELVRSRRWVQADPYVFSAGGLTSGIDLALHVVALYFGEAVAQQTATYMEYESQSWRDGNLAAARTR
jgi:transcriptional regulator GlxA family with amidase domain